MALAHTLARFNLKLGRLKTGTPPRLARDSVDWHGLQADWGDASPEPFSFMSAGLPQPQIDCRITGTTAATHAIVLANLDRSAMYGGAISGRGPRYCPSLEDKVVRFTGRDRHQIFLEPEGLPDTPDGATIYPNGISTSLPLDVQRAVIASIPGLEQARASRGRATPSSMTTSIRAPCAHPWKFTRYQGCSWPARSTAPPGTRKPRHRGYWPASTLPGELAGTARDPGSRLKLHRCAD